MIPCPVCGTAGCPAIETWGEYRMRRCPACSLVYCDPMAYDRMSYDLAYVHSAEGSSTGERSVGCAKWLAEAGANFDETPWLLFEASRRAIEWIVRTIPQPAEVLDCGCGAGWLLAGLRARGYTVRGVEVAAAPVALLRQHGFDVVQGSLEAVPDQWQPRVVTLMDVLEHLPDPLFFLAKLRRRFPQAALIITVPSPRRWTLLPGLHDPADVPPNHLTRWTARSLKTALTKAGYGGVDIVFPQVSALEMASVSYRALAASWVRGCRPGSPVDDDQPKRSVQEEVRCRRNKARLATMPAALLTLAGRSALSMLAIAEPSRESLGHDCA